MHSDHINHEYLDPVVAGERRDVLYHLGVSTDDPLLDALRDVQAVVMAGSGLRIDMFARQWSAMNHGSPIVAFPHEDRFVTRYTGGVLFVSHGMGMPSASIAVQELMRLTYFLKEGDLDAVDSVTWLRVGTSGGVGLPSGTTVISTEAVLVDLKPYRLLDGQGGYHWFDGTFPQSTIAGILEAHTSTPVPLVTGKTVTADEFFIEQFRRDGAIALATVEEKKHWLEWLENHDVRNIEMEGAMFAGYMNYWGFSRFAMICSTVVNRLEGDQITSTPAELAGFNERAGQVAFNYLRQVT